MSLLVCCCCCCLECPCRSPNMVEDSGAQDASLTVASNEMVIQFLTHTWHFLGRNTSRRKVVVQRQSCCRIMVTLTWYGERRQISWDVGPFHGCWFNCRVGKPFGPGQTVWPLKRTLLFGSAHRAYYSPSPTTPCSVHPH